MRRVALLRRVSGERHIGHTGTLDPNATGVLPVCVGNATKLFDILTDRTKEYETVKCGYSGNKVLTFNVEGPSVSIGQSMSISIGSKTKQYSAIVSKSAIKKDNQGEYVYKIM